MCDTQKYITMYQDIQKLTPEDTLQLMLESDTQEEKEFFAMLGNYLLQQKQKRVIAENLF